LDNTDISILGKGKTPISTNSIEAYNKKTLDDKIRKLTTTNIQLIADKMKIEKTKINLEADKIRLFGKKNSLIVKKEEFRTKIAILNTTGPFNALIYNY